MMVWDMSMNTHNRTCGNGANLQHQLGFVIWFLSHSLPRIWSGKGNKWGVTNSERLRWCLFLLVFWQAVINKLITEVERFGIIKHCGVDFFIFWSGSVGGNKQVERDGEINVIFSKWHQLRHLAVTFFFFYMV